VRYDPERGSDGVIRRDNEQEFHVMITSTITSQALFPIMAINREEAISILRKKVQDKEIVPKVILQYDTI
jgi:hypothetical protein